MPMAVRVLLSSACHADTECNPMHVAEFKLTDLLGSAGATIGIIIGGVIFLQFLSSKYDSLAGRYRELTRDYRGQGQSHRHESLQYQIRVYRRRLRLLNSGSWLAGG